MWKQKYDFVNYNNVKLRILFSVFIFNIQNWHPILTFYTYII